MTPEERRDLRESLREAIAPLGREIGELKQTTQRIDDTLRSKQIEDAAREGQVDEKLTDMRGDINGIGGKMRDHIDHHWKWIASTTAVVGAILGAAKFLAGG